MPADARGAPPDHAIGSCVRLGGRREHGLDDLLVAAAAAQVAGQALGDLGDASGAARARVELRRDHLARDAVAALGRASLEERALERGQAVVRGRGPRRSSIARRRRPRPRAPGRSRRSRPSTRTVQAPHSPTRQHSFVPVSPRSSRRTSRRVCCAATSRTRVRPFTVTSMGMRRHRRHHASPSRCSNGRSRCARRARAPAASPAGSQGSPASTAAMGWQQRRAAPVGPASRGPRHRGIGEDADLVHDEDRPRTEAPVGEPGDPGLVHAAAQRHGREVVAATPGPPQVHGPTAVLGSGSSMAVTSSPPAAGWPAPSARRSRRWRCAGPQPARSRALRRDRRGALERCRRRARRCTRCRRASPGSGSGPHRRQPPPRRAPRSRAGSGGLRRCRS